MTTSTGTYTCTGTQIPVAHAYSRDSVGFSNPCGQKYVASAIITFPANTCTGFFDNTRRHTRRSIYNLHSSAINETGKAAAWERFKSLRLLIQRLLDSFLTSLLPVDNEGRV
jgi:hypothetical protein